MVKGEELGDLEKDLVRAEMITNLISKLKSTLDLFEKGNKGEAMEKISQVEGALEELGDSDLVREDEVNEKLALVLEHLEWVKENEDRSSGRS